VISISQHTVQIVSAELDGIFNETIMAYGFSNHFLACWLLLGVYRSLYDQGTSATERIYGSIADVHKVKFIQ